MDAVNPSAPGNRSPRAVTLMLVAVVVFAAYNLNGREIPSYDSQPTKFTGRELALRGTLALDAVIAELPPLAERSGFAVANDGHWRTRYPVAPALPAGLVGAVLHHAGVLDLTRVFAANIVAKLTASAMVTLAVVLALIAAHRFTSAGHAVLVALAFAFGTGLWPTASQTLWQHETVLVGLTGGLAVLTAKRAGGRAAALAAGALLALAVAARLQVLPAVLVVTVLAARRRETVLWTLAPIALILAAIVAANVAWFGHPLGGAAALELLHPAVHGTDSSLNPRPWEGLAGLLVSPSRGLLIYSPVVLVSLAGVAGAWRQGPRSVPSACLAAAAVQTLAYSAYSVWWGGHTFGPRYMLDVLPLLVPAAALGAAVVAGRAWAKGVALLLLSWSVAVSATGAFCYPAERWNTQPENVDTKHERLWDWGDPQIRRCWQTGLSPQNFAFSERENWTGR